MLPKAGLTDQVTAVFVVPATVAVNVCALDAPRLTLPGDTVTLTGCARVMLTLADFDGSATLAAVTVTICCDVIADGAV